MILGRISKILFRIVTPLAFLALCACQGFETELRVLPRSSSRANLVLNSEKGPLELVPGRYPVRVVLPKKGGQDYKLLFKDKTRGEIAVPLRLPSVTSLLFALESVDVRSEDLGQAVDLTLAREVRGERSQLNAAFSDPKSGELLAFVRVSEIPGNALGEAGSAGPSSDAADSYPSADFFRDYQRLKLSQRGAYVPIDGNLEKWGFWASIADRLGNTSARAILAPWIHDRYQHVQWRVGSDEKDPDGKMYRIFHAWEELLRKSPIVDFFAFLHGRPNGEEGSDIREIRPLYYLPKKKSQFRLAYTAGCGSRSALSYIRDFNAVVAAGHPASSPSPIFAFSIIRAWTQGQTGAKSLRHGYEEGKAIATAVYPKIQASGKIGSSLGLAKWSDTKTLLEESEPMFSWTEELNWERISIASTVAPARKTRKQTEIYEARISEYASADTTFQRTKEYAPLDLSYNLCALRYHLEESWIASFDSGVEFIPPQLIQEQKQLYKKALSGLKCIKPEI